MEGVIWLFIILVVGGGILAGVIDVVVMSNKGKKNKAASNNVLYSHGYAVTKELGSLLIDENHRKWTIAGYSQIFDYSDIIDISETQNGKKQKISGGIGAGFGTGSVGIGLSSSRNINTTITSWTIDITVRNSASPLVQIVLFSGSTIKVGDFTYNTTNMLRNQYVAQLKQMQDSGMQNIQNSHVIPEVKISDNVIKTKVVGVTKNNDENIPIQTILPTINDDSDIFLVRDKDNHFDENAVKVIADRQHIGYLKSGIAQQIAPLLDQGKTVDVELLEITGGEGKYYGCNIELTVFN